MKSTIVIIPAAGTGDRMGFDKITSKLNGTPLLVRTIRAVSAAESISGIILAVSPDMINEIKKNIVDKYKLYKVMKIVEGNPENIKLTTPFDWKIGEIIGHLITE